MAKKIQQEKSRIVSLQIRVGGIYLEAFERFKANNAMDCKTNTSAIMAMIRTLPEYVEVLRPTKPTKTRG